MSVPWVSYCMGASVQWYFGWLQCW